jgi:hypothetical protein
MSSKAAALQMVKSAKSNTPAPKKYATRRATKKTANAPKKPVRVVQVDYTESQVAHLCGKHALNMLLQEEKFVWLPSRALFIDKLTGKALPSDKTDPKSTNVQINLWNYCRIFGLREIQNRKDAYLDEESSKLLRQLAAEPTLEDEYYTRSKGKFASEFPSDLAHWKKNKLKFGDKTKEEIEAILAKDYTEDTLDTLADGGIGCTMTGVSRGDVPFAMFRELLDMLGYTYEEAQEDDWTERVTPYLKTRPFLGLLINQGTWHYVAAPKYATRKTCKSGKYTFANSTDRPAISCFTKRQLFKHIEDLPPTRMFIVFAHSPDAYQSVAVQRMKRGTRVKN